ncbi:DUF4047 domain-containing protein [Rossellomorea vietnamensis]|uniref:DUF4047 domain-containing protein n=1 Tax=Rossellomorea vietnamensis TaxID=218284 RepID=A0ACD4C3S2_9BACI|nr:DUF4047 domain-containing protein [Rossellomorea vietnamensis]UXH43281.1 DUF4047 domain-containing protein [Rossellomorea vietnamensis]
MRRIHRTILMPSLCCMAFYAGTQLVGETEAAFTSQASPESITMKAAFVFPGTIQDLEEGAQKVSGDMENTLKKIVAPSPGASMEELERQLEEVTAVEGELTRQMGMLQHLYEEMATYYRGIQQQKAADVHTYDYVREGFQHIEGLWKEVDFSHIEEIRSSILLQMQELEDRDQPAAEDIQTAPETEPSKTDPENSESGDEVKGVTEHEREAMENRE